MLGGVQQAIELNELRFRDIIHCNADAMVVISKSGHIEFANPAAETLLGRPSRDLIGDTFAAPLQPGQTTEVELTHVGGRRRVAEMRVVETTWWGHSAYLASLRDISERKAAGDALRFLAESNQSLAGSLQSSETIAKVAQLAVKHLADICLVDLLENHLLHRTVHARGGCWRAATAAGLNQYWTSDMPRPRTLLQMLESPRPHILNSPRHESATGLFTETARLDLFQELAPQRLMIVPLCARGRTIGALAFVSCDEDRYYDEQELALAVELAQRAALAIDNARMYDESRAAVRHRDQFLAMLAHELRNPLAAVLTAAEFLRRQGNESDALTGAGEVIERQGRHMARLIDDLLDLSRVTQGKIQLKREVVDVALVLSDAVAASRPLIDARRHRLREARSSQPIYVDADASRLAQVVANLLNNAAKYMEPGGEIELTCHALDDEAVISVADRGAGIAGEDRARIFDLFVQVDRSLDRSGGGVGIGLTLVRRLVEMHGGSVSVESAGLGQGSRFTVRLPRHVRYVEAPAFKPAALAAVRRRIAIVEDNDDTREMLQSLMRLEGHEVHVAADGPTGLSLILTQQPDAALIDIGLPGLDGYEVARKLRRQTPACTTRLIALTGYGQPKDRELAIQAGFDEHLTKPVKFEELFAAIEAATRCEPVEIAQSI